MKRSKRVLVIDDEFAVRFGIRAFLEASGYEVDEAENARQAHESLRQRTPDVIVLDYALQQENALDVLPRLRAVSRSVPIVVLTGYGTIDLAVRTMQAGAEQFLVKPVEMNNLRGIID